jgi:hypothetical protein
MVAWRLEHPHDTEPPKHIPLKMVEYERLSRRNFEIANRLQRQLWEATYDWTIQTASAKSLQNANLGDTWN